MNPKNEILQGDTLTILKTIDDDYFDLGITSPPYNKGLAGGQLVKKVEYDLYSDNIPEEIYQQQQIEVLNEIYRTTKPGGSFFYNHRCRWSKGTMIHPIMFLSKTDWAIKQEIIWNRKITGNLRGWRFWQIDERIYWLYKPIKSLVGDELQSKHAKLSAIWEIPPESKNPHPAPFPIDIPARIIYSMFDDDKDKIVLDPYMGSGTVGVACKLFGCDYAGIDISKDYIDMSNERIDNYLNYKDKYDKEINKHVLTGKTYKQRKAEKAAKAKGD
jgi:modification methylase